MGGYGCYSPHSSWLHCRPGGWCSGQCNSLSELLNLTAAWIINTYLSLLCCTQKNPTPTEVPEGWCDALIQTVEKVKPLPCSTKLRQNAAAGCGGTVLPQGAPCQQGQGNGAVSTQGSHSTPRSALTLTVPADAQTSG